MFPEQEDGKREEAAAVNKAEREDRIPVSGKRLYEMRCRKNLTLQETADLVGKHKSTLCRLEQEEPAMVSREFLEKICRAGEVGPEYFEEEKIPEDKDWYRIMSPEEVASVYEGLSERDKLRISRLLEDA